MDEWTQFSGGVSTGVYAAMDGTRSLMADYAFGLPTLDVSSGPDLYGMIWIGEFDDRLRLKHVLHGLRDYD